MSILPTGCQYRLRLKHNRAWSVNNPCYIGRWGCHLSSHPKWPGSRQWKRHPLAAFSFDLCYTSLPLLAVAVEGWLFGASQTEGASITT